MFDHSTIHYLVDKYNAVEVLPDIKTPGDRAVWFFTENFFWLMTPQRPDGARDVIVQIKRSQT